MKIKRGIIKKTVVVLFVGSLAFNLVVGYVENNNCIFNLETIIVLSTANAESDNQVNCIDYGNGCYSNVWYAHKKEK